MMDLFSTQGLVSLVTLVAMEIVLGIDNIIFISILTGKLEAKDRRKARNIGLALALVMRIILLFFISFLASMKEPILTVMGLGFSGRSLILLAGGLFLMAKSTTEIHGKLEAADESDVLGGKSLKLANAIIQIIFLDIVFSFDSILTAIGLVQDVGIMITAVIISMFVMLLFSKAVGDFVNRHPSIKMLALSFLLMIGLLLVAEAVPEPYTIHVPKGYIYFAMAFSLLVELLNIRARRPKKK